MSLVFVPFGPSVPYVVDWAAAIKKKTLSYFCRIQLVARSLLLLTFAPNSPPGRLRAELKRRLSREC